MVGYTVKRVLAAGGGIGAVLATSLPLGWVDAAAPARRRRGCLAAAQVQVASHCCREIQAHALGDGAGCDLDHSSKPCVHRTYRRKGGRSACQVLSCPAPAPGQWLPCRLSVRCGAIVKK
jgi:hypothetical protein